jgi:hypothetical protein
MNDDIRISQTQVNLSGGVGIQVGQLKLGGETYQTRKYSCADLPTLHQMKDQLDAALSPSGKLVDVAQELFQNIAGSYRERRLGQVEALELRMAITKAIADLEGTCK